MDGLLLLNLMISSGVLAGVARLIWMLSHHEARIDEHDRRLNNLEKIRSIK